ncbi:hypothetical protein NITHO_3270009 [Nitrolancea hollandica Lb]|uniref:Uncharacterized protein n=1 Tax=Nitrolancea hollandica Lb TaxID=1129897 RepID=I4EHT9_9BACT|nr:hypothetical protein NITHO_3270009 [Nitrolancea hollandica Lb]
MTRSGDRGRPFQCNPTAGGRSEPGPPSTGSSSRTCSADRANGDLREQLGLTGSFIHGNEHSLEGFSHVTWDTRSGELPDGDRGRHLIVVTGRASVFSDTFHRSMEGDSLWICERRPK